MSREICDLDLFKDPKGLTDVFYECEKVTKTSWLFIFKRLHSVFTSFRRDAAF